jgi:prepilin-type processing-associated H-X9-DG protein
MSAVLVGAGLAPVRKGQPLPLHPVGSVRVSDAADLVENAEGGAVFIWGMAAACWGSGDVVARRFAAVQLVLTGAATEVEAARAFGAGEASVQRWIARFRRGGVEGLAPARRGPKGPWKLTEEMQGAIRELHQGGATKSAIAAAVGVSRDTVSRVLDEPVPGAVAPVAMPSPGDAEADLVPLARPEPRDAERQAARRGELAEARPQVTCGASLPLGGALVIVPALTVTGLLACFEETYGRAKAAFYGIRSLVLTLVFASLVGEPRAEGLTRIDPVDLGRLLGLDRAPEPKTLRRRIAALAEQNLAERLLGALARRHAEAHPDALGVLYVDGHVRAYHGGANVPKAHVARIRLSMPAEVDTWVADANGDGLLVFSAPPGASLVAELRRVTTWARGVVGPDRRTTICFDRGGWSPALFAELHQGGFDILTYRKGPKRPEPRRGFSERTFVDDAGRVHTYWLADRRVRISYQLKGRRRLFACRQITRLDAGTGHQTQILTTRTDPDPASLAHAMFSRWRQENFFRYMRAHYGLDALDAYQTAADDPTRMVRNPARLDADRKVREARAVIEAAEAEEGRAAVDGRRDDTRATTIDAAFAAARAELVKLSAAARALPAKVPIGDVHTDAVRLHPERKRIHDAIRLATYNAESALARLLVPHYRRADDEARSLLREISTTPADLDIVGDKLHVRINPLSAPRRTRALAGLCADLTATETTYPGTQLTLVYTVKDT